MESIVRAGQDERSSEQERLLLSQPSSQSNFTSNQVHQLTDLLLKIDSRLDSMETRLRNLESVRTPRCTQTVDGFPKFRLLPTEIRLRIWDFAIPRRILRHHYTDSREANKVHFAHSLAPPLVSRICRESRSVARRRGDIFQLARRKRGQNDEVEYYWTWFDGSHDVLELGAPKDWDCGTEDGGCLELMSRAECLLVSVDAVRDDWIDALFHWEPVRQTLRSIYIQRFPPESVSKKKWRPRVVAELFGHNSVVLVDVEDLDEVKRVYDILEPAEQSLTSKTFFTTQCHLEGWLERWQNVKAGSEVKLQSKRIRKAVEVFKKAWLVRDQIYPKNPDYRPSSTLPEPDVHDEVKLGVGMPQTRIACVVHLGEDACAASGGELTEDRSHRSHHRWALLDSSDDDEDGEDDDADDSDDI